LHGNLTAVPRDLVASSLAVLYFLQSFTVSPRSSHSLLIFDIRRTRSSTVQSLFLYYFVVFSLCRALKQGFLVSNSPDRASRAKEGSREKDCKDVVEHTTIRRGGCTGGSAGGTAPARAAAAPARAAAAAASAAAATTANSTAAFAAVSSECPVPAATGPATAIAVWAMASASGVEHSSVQQGLAHREAGVRDGVVGRLRHYHRTWHIPLD
jgi:hypothetical protein